MMVKPSMVKPLGLSSERDEFKRRHVVTRLRSVTLLCRIVTDHAGQVELSVKPENNHNVIPYLYGTDEE
mgnify:CR=1 FL=1